MVDFFTFSRFDNRRYGLSVGVRQGCNLYIDDCFTIFAHEKPCFLG